MNTFKLILLEERIVLDASAAGVIFVDQSSAYNQSATDVGSSWTKAYNTLDAALAYSNQTALVEQVWVAKGTYSPNTTDPYTNRGNKTFLISNDVLMYGGFKGTEASLADRTPSKESYLSGDLLGNDLSNRADANYTLSKADNAWHVLTIGNNSSANGGGKVLNVTLDGFTIQNGYAGGPVTDINATRGGGIWARGVSTSLFTSLTLNNLHVVNNETVLVGTNVNTGIGAGVYVALGNLNMTNSLLDHNATGYAGGALAIVSGSANIANSTFDHNISLAVLNQGFLDPKGAAAFFSGCGTVTIDHSDFTNNSANGFGGAIIYTTAVLPNSPSRFTVTNSLFENNYAGIQAGAIYLGGRTALNATDKAIIAHTRFINNNGSWLAGAFESDSLNTEMIDCQFIGNTAQMGGAVNFSNFFALARNIPLGRFSVKDSYFFQNEATGGLMRPDVLLYLKGVPPNNFGAYPVNLPIVGGGAIVNDEGAISTVDNCVFQNNTAPNGGAISNIGYSQILPRNAPISWPGTLTVQNSLFLNNSASGDGGAISSKGWSLIGFPNYGATLTTITNSTFLSNTAHGYGGAIAGENTNLIIQSSTIQANMAYLNGGGIALINSSSNILQDVLQANHAKEDGDQLWADASSINSLNTPIDILTTLTDNNTLIPLHDDSIVIV